MRIARIRFTGHELLHICTFCTCDMRQAVQVVDRAARGGRGKPSVSAVDNRPTGASGEQPANAVVADLGEGLEALHLYTGRPLCALTLPSPGLHADVNGDGVLDHVYVRAALGGVWVCKSLAYIWLLFMRMLPLYALHVYVNTQGALNRLMAG